MTMDEIRKMRDWNRLCASDAADGPMSKRGHTEHADALDALLAVADAAADFFRAVHVHGQPAAWGPQAILCGALARIGALNNEEG